MITAYIRGEVKEEDDYKGASDAKRPRLARIPRPPVSRRPLETIKSPPAPTAARDIKDCQEDGRQSQVQVKRREPRQGHYGSLISRDRASLSDRRGSDAP